ncbi:MAG TPA: TonB family protein [Candidatus Obscuribacterales bacterium]
MADEQVLDEKLADCPVEAQEEKPASDPAHDEGRVPPGCAEQVQIPQAKSSADRLSDAEPALTWRSSATLTLHLERTISSAAPRSTLIASILTIAASIAWIATFISTGYAGKVLPWCITLAGIAIAACLQLPAGGVNSRSNAEEGKRENASRSADTPHRLFESFTASYLAFSIVLCAWMMLLQFKPERKTVAARQFIDIELASPTDYVKRDELLPSTKDADTLRKRTGSTEKMITAVAVQPRSIPPKAERNMTETEEAGDPAPHTTPQSAPEAKTITTIARKEKTSQSAKSGNAPPANVVRSEAAPLPEVKLPEGWRVFQAERPMAKSPAARAGLNTKTARSQNEPMLFEEVAPIELYELADNSGDAGIEVWQSGGRSEGGKGAPSTLQEYLKNLHKRIKRAWTPPHGDPRVAEVLFRISREGKLTSVRLLTSSGHQDADRAAMEAIMSCAPYKSLPSDYQPAFLDIRYTFNYRTDELTEVKNAYQ